MLDYKLVSRKDPRDENSVAKFYALAISSGHADLRSIAEKISDRCTLTTVDTVAVLEALVGLIPQELADGKIVQLGDFGTFRTTFRSEGAETEDEFTKLKIKETKVHFRQGLEFKRKFSNLKFSKKAS